MNITLRCRPAGLPVYFVCLRIVFSFVGGDYCTNTVPCFYHTLIEFGALHCALLLMITTPAQRESELYNVKFHTFFGNISQAKRFEAPIQ